MFELMIGLSVWSFVFAFIGFTGVLFILRLLEVIIRKIRRTDALIVLFVPFSLGYFYLIPASSPLKSLYRALVITLFVLTLVGSFFIFYMQK
jgi:hypothetical protein